MENIDEDSKLLSSVFIRKNGRRQGHYSNVKASNIIAKVAGTSTADNDLEQEEENEEGQELIHENQDDMSTVTSGSMVMMESKVFAKHEWVRIQSMKSKYDNCDAQVKGCVGKIVHLKIYYMMPDGIISIQHSNISAGHLRLLDDAEIEAANNAIVSSYQNKRKRPSLPIEDRDEDEERKKANMDEDAIVGNFNFPYNSWVRIISPDSKYFNCDGQVKGLAGTNKKYPQIRIYSLNHDGSMLIKTSTVSYKCLRLLSDPEVEAIKSVIEEHQALFKKDAAERAAYGVADDDQPDSERFSFNDWVRIDCYKSKYDNCTAVVKGFSGITRQFHQLQVFVMHPDGSFSVRASSISNKYLRHLSEAEIKEVKELIAGFKYRRKMEKKRIAAGETEDGEGPSRPIYTAEEESGASQFVYNDWVRIKCIRSKYDNCYAQVKGFGGITGRYPNVHIYILGPEGEVTLKTSSISAKHLRFLTPAETELIKHIIGDKETAKKARRGSGGKKRARLNESDEEIAFAKDIEEEQPNEEIDPVETSTSNQQMLLTYNDSDSDEEAQ